MFCCWGTHIQQPLSCNCGYPPRDVLLRGGWHAGCFIRTHNVSDPSFVMLTSFTRNATKKQFEFPIYCLRLLAVLYQCQGSIPFKGVWESCQWLPIRWWFLRGILRHWLNILSIYGFYWNTTLQAQLILWNCSLLRKRFYLFIAYNNKGPIFYTDFKALSGLCVQMCLSFIHSTTG